MQSFSIRDLRERTGDISRAAEEGELSLVTRHGHPLFISVPFNQRVVENGVYLALAENLFKSGELSLGKAAKLGNMSKVEFGEHVSRLGIPLVNYDASELEAELDYFS
jgi:predicted HTH domain antitoxin